MKALLWDNDGVLVDTEPLYFRATKEILAGLGVELDEASYIEVSLRRGESLFQLAGGVAERAKDFKELRDARNELYREFVSGEVEVLDGVEECLESLHRRVPMAIVTGM